MTLCVVAGILVSVAVVMGPVRVWKLSHDRAAHEQKTKPYQNTIWDEEYVQAQIMEYLEERYHEKFVMKSYQCYLGNWAGNYVEMEVWPEGKEDDKYLFLVRGYRNENDELDYEDTYFDLQLKKKIKDYFQPCIDEYYDEYLSYYVILSPFTDSYRNLPVDISIEELLELNEFMDYVSPYLCVELHLEPQEDYNDEIMEALAKRLQENQFRGELQIALSGKHEKHYQSFSFLICADKIESTE